MRKPFQLLFLLLGVLMLAVPAGVAAQDTEMWLPEVNPDNGKFVSKAAKLRTSASTDPDTIWIGHIPDPTWRPKDRDGNDITHAGIQTGGYGPYRIGRGVRRPGVGPGANYVGVWDFDSFGGPTPAEGSFPARAAEHDSLQGLWPVARPFQSGDFAFTDDKLRPFFGLDYGNVGNYVINQGSPKRTFGVTGYWHRDVGRNSLPLADSVGGVPTVGGIGGVIPGPNVEWKPIAGGASAWCGLRAENDNTHIDPLTGNAYNHSVMQYRFNNSFNQVGSQSVLGTDANYPGYGSQWDQMLYQDIVLSSNSDVTVSWKHATNMSRVSGGSATQRIGYFYLDPTAMGAGNFISAADAAATFSSPVDSFMVYVGLPVDDGACRYFDGTIAPVYDPLRRWFSEVLRLDTGGGLGNVHQLASVAGETGTMASDGTITPVANSVVIPGSVLSTKLGLGSGGGTVRLVFRVKTNRGSDDEDYGAPAAAFTSRTRGAAIIDDVSVTQGGGNLVDHGDFESASAVDNAAATTAAWHSTGKPPGVYAHIHSVDPNSANPALWNDPCSPPVLSDPSAPNRACNMVNNVMSGGDHDNAEKPGGEFGGPDQDRSRWVATPTINLKSTGVGDYNGMGIDSDLADAVEWTGAIDIHTPGFRGNVNGNFFSWGVQSYPAKQRNGHSVWGETRHGPFITFFGANLCITFQTLLKSAGLFVTSNSSGVPDSVRVYFQFLSRCFTFANLNANTCSPTEGTLVGNYIDNMAVSLVQVAAEPPPGLSILPWFKLMDAFPSNPTTNFASSNFDTMGAQLRSAINNSLLTGLSRPAVSGDTAWVQTGLMPLGSRVDLVFRVLPGVGNYVQIGNRASGLRKVPTSTTPVSEGATSSNFWESYLADNGAFGTGGNGTSGPGHPGTNTWDPNIWNSARMDTVEANLFPATTMGANIPGLNPTLWATMYHESDPKFTTLGVAKNRCFAVDPSLGRSLTCRSKTTTSVVECNVICGDHPVSTQFPPVWTEDLNSGVPLSENGLPPGRTYEYTKIIPDGLLTPGAHVQYFFRRAPGLGKAVDILPDTNFVFGPGAIHDGARWLHASVLPDRWKGFSATGMACMLVVDWGDRRFDEFFWVTAADSIGLTLADKRGAHNGWRARGDQNVQLVGNIGGDDSIARRDNGGQPGTYWDLWNTAAGESQTTASAWISSRAAVQPSAGELVEGRQNRNGPTGDMLRFFYRNLVYLTGDLKSTYFGRLPNKTDDDLAVLNDFAFISGGTAKPRSVYVIGDGFPEALSLPALSPPDGGLAFVNSYFGVNLKDKSYRLFSNNTKPIATYHGVSGSAFNSAGASFGLSDMTFGVADGCGLENDVLEVNTAVTQAAAQIHYENVGNANDPHVGAILAPAGGSREQTTYVEGVRIQRIASIINYNAQGNPVFPMSNAGFRAYMYKSLSIVSGTLGCGPQGAPVGVGDDPSRGGGTAFVNFLSLKSSNPMKSGQARIAFGVARTERVRVNVYDVTGRLIRTVADRIFQGGQEHVVIWDGTNETGERVKSGVYFYQLKTPTWTSQRKLAVLAN
jgi:hypothetical protein